MDKFEKFQKTIFSLVGELIRSKFEQAKDNEQSNIIKELLCIETEKKKGVNASKKDIFLMELFKRFTEIDSSYKQLKDVEVYIRQFPYENTSISKSRYLQYHIGNYFNEMYILKERLCGYLNKLNRLYSKDHRYEIIEKLTKVMSDSIQNTFNGITNIRGHHVHEYRYLDKELLRIGALEGLIESIGEDFIETLSFFLQRSYKQSVREWNHIIQKNNEEIKNLFNIYFDALSKILFGKKGKLIFP